MKAIYMLLAVSLAANGVLGWMLWQQHPETSPEPALVQQSAPSGVEALPLPTKSVPLTVSPLLPLAGAAAVEPRNPSPPDAQTTRPVTPSEEVPYGPPLPPNRHAYPPWPERVPYGETQFERALLTVPKR